MPRCVRRGPELDELSEFIKLQHPILNIWYRLQNELAQIMLRIESLVGLGAFEI